VKIDSAALSMSATHAAAVRRERREVLRAWRGPTRPDFEGRERAQASGANGSAAELSTRARRALQNAGATTLQAARTTSARQTAETRTDAVESEGADAADQIRIAVIEALLKQATGREVRVRVARVTIAAPDTPSLPTIEIAPAAPPAPAGWGLEYDLHEALSDTEQTTVAISGEIRTADGVRLRVAVEATLSRAFETERTVSIRAGDAIRKDPLVIHFDGPASALGEGRFAFDLDADGAAESVPTLAAGSGFLVLDRDADDHATDGRELFGPATGNGFAELAGYDADGNGWIDAGDEVFERLRVWRPAADGSGQLQSLAELGVGAIGLGRVATPFEFRDAANRTTGVAVSTGLYVADDGRAGLVQQIDLTV